MVAIALVASAMFAGPTLAHHKPGHVRGNPPGEGAHDNRGTVKVHEGAGETSPAMRNQAQVCEFHIHMFKFHAAQALTISIVGHGGNAGSSTYEGTVTTNADGEARAPEAGAISDFEDGTYKVTVDNGRGGPGKHKVFHVDCAEENPIPGSGNENAGPEPGNGPEIGRGNSPEAPPKPGNLPDSATDGNAAQSAQLFTGVGLLLAAAIGFAILSRRRVTAS